MKTKLVIIEGNELAVNNLVDEASNIIRTGGLVAFPTETVYGLGANALDQAASKKIYQAKGRPSDNPLIVHIADEQDLLPLVTDISDQAKILIRAFWPGPLTMIFNKSKIVPYGTTGGLDTVAVRMPDHQVARALIQRAGVPIAAPSANTSGRPSPTLANHVFDDLNGKIEMILDGGKVGIGLESTIVDLSGRIPVLLRPGAVTISMLEDKIGQIAVDRTILEPMKPDQWPKAPGMKYKHYAPKAELILVEGQVQHVAAEILRRANEKIEQGLKVGILCSEETKAYYLTGEVRVIGKRSQPETVAAHLFGVLREFDQIQVDVIYSESFSKEELGLAIMNRLMKAAGYQMISVEGGH